MPRIDDYNQALELGRKELSGKNPDHVARFSGAEMYSNEHGNTFLSLHFLHREIIIFWPELEFFYERNSGKELPIQQRILLLHYLYGAWSSRGTPIKGEWIGDHKNRDKGGEKRIVDIRCADAAAVKVPPGSLDAVITDPPYFANIQYAELMDFCYVWLRRLVGQTTQAFENST